MAHLKKHYNAFVCFYHDFISFVVKNVGLFLDFRDFLICCALIYKYKQYEKWEKFPA